MLRYLPFALITLGALCTAAAAAVVSPWWAVAALPLAALTLLGVYDLVQWRNSILRTYPVAGHLRYVLMNFAPEIHQYFVESSTDGRPYDKRTRDIVAQRATQAESESPFGSDLDLEAPGAEFFAHTIASRSAPERPPRVRIGGPHCTQPYEMALLNVSAMSFGALSVPAVRALNAGAKIGGFAHDTGEGGLSRYHLEGGGDIVWELGSGYFGCRTPEGRFDPQTFEQKARLAQVKMIEIKLSQGAKPGIGGVLPGAKVSTEIAEARDVPEGQTCISPPAHAEFSTPLELIDFIGRLREGSGGKPVGIKLCIGRRTEFLAICKAMVETGDGPDFITVDGSEGGTGAAPLEFEDVVGAPLTEGLLFVHNALMGAGLRDCVAIGASGKVATGADIVRRLSQGADYCNAARAMMLALGCIQAKRCHTNTCPTGITTQDPKRWRSLDTVDKAQRVASFQRATVQSAQRLMGAMGIEDPRELRPSLLHRHDTLPWSRDYTDLYDWLDDGQLVDGSAAETWMHFWNLAQTGSFAPTHVPTPVDAIETTKEDRPRWDVPSQS